MPSKSYGQLGYEHGLAGIRALAHRRCRPYDSHSANRAYNSGYRKGAYERLKSTGKTLDYDNPLNSQFFGDNGGNRMK